MSSPNVQPNLVNTIENWRKVLFHEGFVVAPQILKELEGLFLTMPKSDVIVRDLAVGYAASSLSQRFLEFSIEQELKDTTSNVFREDSMWTIVVQYYIFISGKEYLKKILKEAFAAVIHSNQNTEIDPSRLTPEDNEEKNFQHLLKLCEGFLSALFDSVDLFPPHLVGLFKEIAQRAEPEKFRQFFISLFMLRFFVPAVISPFQYQLIESPIKNHKNRSLILIAKIIQSVANGETPHPGNYMFKVADFIRTQKSRFDIFFKAIMEKEGFLGVFGEPLNGIDMLRVLTNTISIFPSINSNIIQERVLPLILKKEGSITVDTSAFVLLGQVQEIYDEMSSISTNDDEGSREMIPGTLQIPEVKVNFVEWVHSQIRNYPFFVILPFRGSFCLLCKKYLKEWSKYVYNIRSLGGEIFGVSSMTQQENIETKKKWNLDFDLIGDPDQTLCQWYDIPIDNDKLWAQFQERLNQPGVIVLSREREILYYWKVVPSAQNLYGARGRPRPSIVIDTISSKIETLEPRNDAIQRARKASVAPSLAALVDRVKTSEKGEYQRLIAEIIASEEHLDIVKSVLKQRQKELKEKKKKSKGK